MRLIPLRQFPAVAFVLLACVVTAVGAEGQGHVVGIGESVVNSAWHEESFAEVAAGEYHTVVRRSDGSIVAWGLNNDGQCNVPTLPTGLSYVEVAAGRFHTVARRSDGSVVAWGDNGDGQCNVPALPPGLSYVEVAAGYSHTVARLSDGSVVAWGSNGAGECNVPALPPGLSYVEVAAGFYHTVARRSDGSVVACGNNGAGQCNVPALPPGLSYVEVAAGEYHTVLRRSDGSVVAWGWNGYGQCNVPTLNPGQTYFEVAASSKRTLALYSGAPNYEDSDGDGYGSSKIVCYGNACSPGTSLITGDCDDTNPFVNPGATEVCDGIDNNCDGIVDEEIGAPDCNGNGASDACDIALGTSNDFNSDGIPDECQCAAPYAYCTALINSTGKTASMGYTGSTSLTLNDLKLTVTDGIPNQIGIFFMGSFQTQVPFGDGHLCITGNIQRLMPPVFMDAAGAGSFTADFTDPTSPLSMVQPLSEWNLQFWYRDPQPIGNQFNLSDALHVQFCP
jgi:hypothetical protein